MEAIQVNNITKRYAQHLALSGVSMNIPKGSIFGLLGPNGAGKTTLIRIINQIIQADEGEILVLGEKLRPSHIEVIGYLPEERGLYKKMKVGEHLLFLAQLKGLSHKEALGRIKSWMVKFEITDWWNKKIEDLSKGMAQKIQFIGTVIHEPKVVILDEPFSGFDPINANLIKDEIFELREKGSTIIFSTHRMESVEELCDHIALINKSKKILDGSKRDIKNQFRSNTYLIEHKGNGFALSGNYDVISSQLIEDDFHKTKIKITDGSSPNQLLTELIGKTEIHNFTELVPNMNDIFILKVGQSNHE
ncbi:MAG TPA: ABC transporter ATP-binding protein [Cyclobacteriaceae bacterium]|nr:ABC transporter ATP-binding protein [Cyclobacteriaceae bacterium]